MTYAIGLAFMYLAGYYRWIPLLLDAIAKYRASKQPPA